MFRRAGIRRHKPAWRPRVHHPNGLGALLLAVLANGTVLLNVSGFWQRVIVGFVVLLAVLVDLFRRPG